MEDSDEKKEPNDETLSSTKPKFKVTFHECKVCGAPALHSNYGAITCSPCKIFFKRNATIKNVSYEICFLFLIRIFFRNNLHVILMVIVKSM